MIPLDAEQHTLAEKISALAARGGPRDVLFFTHSTVHHLISIEQAWWIEVRPAGPIARWSMTEYRAGGIAATAMASCAWEVITWLALRLRAKLAPAPRRPPTTQDRSS